MFCKNCGTKVEDANFCGKCGATTDQGKSEVEKKKPTEDNKILFQIKPVFKWGYNILSMSWLVIAFIIMIILMTYEEDFFVFIGVPAIVLILVLGIAVLLTIRRIQYKKIEYNFYATKVQYIDGFLNLKEKEIKYKHVRNVTMTRRVFERMFGLGSIHIDTDVGNDGPELVIHCLENVKEHQEKIKQVIDKAND